MNQLPQSFEAWKSCIENDCKIKLTAAFTKKRISVYQDRKNPETKKFISLYGEDHLNNVLYWFQRAERELGVAN